MFVLVIRTQCKQKHFRTPWNCSKKYIEEFHKDIPRKESHTITEAFNGVIVKIVKQEKPHTSEETMIQSFKMA